MFSSVAVWVGLPELPIEYYDHAILRKIGIAIGPVLRIDAHTASGISSGGSRIVSEGVPRIGHRKEDCPYTIRETHKEAPIGQDDPHMTHKGNNESSSEVGKVDESIEGFGEWMVVTRRKPMNTAKASHTTQQTQEMSPESETSQGHMSKRAPRQDEQSRKEGKRKIPSSPTPGSQRTADKTAKSFPRKDGMKPDQKNLKLHANTTKQTRNLVQTQRNEVGPSNQSPMFSFGVNPIKGLSVGPSPSPIVFSSPTSLPAKTPALKTKTKAIVALANKKNGDQKLLGNLLSRKSHPNWGRNNQVDQIGPDGGRSLGTLFEPMVEASLGLTNDPNPSTGQLGIICNKIKCAPFRKLAFRSRVGVDLIGDNSEENSPGKTSGVRNVGQPSPSETTSICGARDKGNHFYQSDPRKDRDYQALSLSIQGRGDSKEGVDGSIEVEGHRG
ncbi:hypothetical protein CMV_010440 [Castanea mollissima]|uniref:DUF4283 domain-containing protein n=1 Tax=Castanea mollissima TaxID=60419 RepID=A0A8J4W0R0_9ROSI|nr:hypothetical protein CMV_010440 [Castanea mollissima]